jgi:hypothetical protein
MRDSGKKTVAIPSDAHHRKVTSLKLQQTCEGQNRVIIRISDIEGEDVGDAGTLVTRLGYLGLATLGMELCRGFMD